MFIRFDDNSRKMMTLASQIADRLGCRYIGPEHLYLVILDPELGTLHNRLTAIGYDVEKIRKAVVEYAAQSQHTYKKTNTAGLPQTEELKNALNLAIKCVTIRGDAYVEPEHLLCGLIAEEVFGRMALQDFDISPSTLEKRLLPPP